MVRGLVSTNIKLLLLVKLSRPTNQQEDTSSHVHSAGSARSETLPPILFYCHLSVSSNGNSLSSFCFVQKYFIKYS